MESNIGKGGLRAVIFSGLFLLVTNAFAAIDRAYAPFSKKNAYIQDGLVTGGEAGLAYTLLDVRHLAAPKDKIERILLDLGDHDGKPLKNKISYFQVSLDPKSSRVVIDLSQMVAAGVTVETLRKRFQNSSFVKDVKIHYDPIDTSLTILLQLKRKVQLEVFQLPAADKPSRIAIDLKEKV